MVRPQSNLFEQVWILNIHGFESMELWENNHSVHRSGWFSTGILRLNPLDRYPKTQSTG